MKKILISILIILLLILTYFSLAKGIKFLNIKSINNIKDASDKLGEDFNEANELSNKTYPAELEELEEAIKTLKITKQNYESKKVYNIEENTFGTTTIKKYKVHYLWTILGNYRQNRGIQRLGLDLKSTVTEDVYDLEFTLVGEYTNIIDFLYDIENDEQLNFTIENYKVEPYRLKTTTTTTYVEGENAGEKKTEVTNPYNKFTEATDEVTPSRPTETEGEQGQENNSTNAITTYDPRWVEASFTVEDVGITLD